MKKTLLLFVLITNALFASEKPKPAANPAIALIMTSIPMSAGEIMFSFTVKNIGEETLPNITISSMDGITIIGGPIVSLAPGQEDSTTFIGFKNFMCYDVSQAIATSTNTLGNIVVEDYSHPYDFYEDGPTDTYISDMVYGTQDGMYVDANGNSIVDVGDRIDYTYFVPSNDVYIQDNNAIVTNPIGIGPFTTTGVHYLTAADVTEGYVYNESHMQVNDNCTGYGYFNDPTPCSGCPAPSGCFMCIVTKINDLDPNRISGTVKFNTNADNCATGAPFPLRKVSAANGTNTYASFTNNSGGYSILIPNSGTYNTGALGNLGAGFSSNPVATNIVSSGSDVDYANTNFCISSASNYSDLNVLLIPITQARPGFATSYKIVFRNFGTTSLNGSITMGYEGSKLTYINSAPAQSSYTTSTILWNYTNLLPFEMRSITVNFMVQPPPTVNMNDILAFMVTGNTLTTDANPADNTFSLNQTVQSSYDPNDKKVVEGAYISDGQATKYLHYVTRFQNTGTADATTVVLKETLDADLDWSTFEPIAASHNYSVQLVNGNAMTCTFSNINLPYTAANEPASHGWMTYRIKPKTGFAVGDIASSHADIYFDFNPPIITNTVTTQISALATNAFNSTAVRIYPNPATDQIHISDTALENTAYQMIDITGKVVAKGKILSGSISIGQLEKGIYFLKVASKQAVKVIKE